jgi:hypothetical protein
MSLSAIEVNEYKDLDTREKILKKGKDLVLFLKQAVSSNQELFMCAGVGGICITLDMYMPWIQVMMMTIVTKLHELNADPTHTKLLGETIRLSGLTYSRYMAPAAGLVSNRYAYEQFGEDIEDFKLSTDILTMLVKYAERLQIDNGLQGNTVKSIVKARSVLARSNKWITTATDSRKGLLRSGIMLNSIEWWRIESHRLLLTHVSTVALLKTEIDILRDTY